MGQCRGNALAPVLSVGVVSTTPTTAPTDSSGVIQTEVCNNAYYGVFLYYNHALFDAYGMFSVLRHLAGAYGAPGPQGYLDQRFSRFVPDIVFTAPPSGPENHSYTSGGTCVLSGENPLLDDNCWEKNNCPENGRGKAVDLGDDVAGKVKQNVTDVNDVPEAVGITIGACPGATPGGDFGSECRRPKELMFSTDFSLVVSRWQALQASPIATDAKGSPNGVQKPEVLTVEQEQELFDQGMHPITEKKLESTARQVMESIESTMVVRLFWPKVGIDWMTANLTDDPSGESVPHTLTIYVENI